MTDARRKPDGDMWKLHIQMLLLAARIARRPGQAIQSGLGQSAMVYQGVPVERGRGAGKRPTGKYGSDLR